MRTGLGPSSRKTPGVFSSNLLMQPWKLTGEVIWSTQYSALIGDLLLQSPDTFKAIGMRGFWKSMFFRKDANGSTIGDMREVWKARSTGNIRASTPRAISASMQWFKFSRRPPNTSSVGPFTAESSRPGKSFNQSSYSPCSSLTANIPASGQSSLMRRPRSIAMSIPSNGSSTPAPTAAANSPILCPATRVGASPSEAQNLRRLTCIAYKTGCSVAVLAKIWVSGLADSWRRSIKLHPAFSRTTLSKL